MYSNALTRVGSAGTLINSGGILISGEITPVPADDADVTPGTPQFEAAVRNKREADGAYVTLAGALVGAGLAFWALRKK